MVWPTSCWGGAIDIAQGTCCSNTHVGILVAQPVEGWAYLLRQDAAQFMAHLLVAQATQGRDQLLAPFTQGFAVAREAYYTRIQQLCTEIGAQPDDLGRWGCLQTASGEEGMGRSAAAYRRCQQFEEGVRIGQEAGKGVEHIFPPTQVIGARTHRHNCW